MRNVSMAAIVVLAFGFMAQPASSAERPPIQLAGDNDNAGGPVRPPIQLANVDSTLGSHFLMA